MLETIRQCPRCSEGMAKVVVHDVTIDRCERCGGEFYDAGEIEATTEAPCDLEAATCRQRPSKLTCSACGAAMVALDVSYLDVSFEIDRCTECQGLWLDEDEPRKVREVLAAVHEDGCRPAGLMKMLWLFRCF